MQMNNGWYNLNKTAHLTKEAILEVSGMSQLDAARKLGVSPWTLTKRCQSFNIMQPRPTKTRRRNLLLRGCADDEGACEIESAAEDDVGEGSVRRKKGAGGIITEIALARPTMEPLRLHPIFRISPAPVKRQVLQNCWKKMASDDGRTYYWQAGTLSSQWEPHGPRHVKGPAASPKHTFMCFVFDSDTIRRLHAGEVFKYDFSGPDDWALAGNVPPPKILENIKGNHLGVSSAYKGMEEFRDENPDVLKEVTLEVFLELLDHQSSNDAFQALLSRNEVSAKTARNAFLEVMQQLVNRIVRHPSMLEFFGLFPCVGLPTAVAILSSTVDIEVKVESKAMELTRQYARHLENKAVYPKPTNWPPSEEDFLQLLGGNFETYLFTCRQGQKGSGGCELFTTCPALLEAVGRQVSPTDKVQSYLYFCAGVLHGTRGRTAKSVPPAGRP